MLPCYTILNAFILATVFWFDIATCSKVTSHFANACRGGKRFRTRCFRLTDDKFSSYGTSQGDCRFAVIKDYDENNFVMDLIRDSGEQYVWIGRERGDEFEMFGHYDSDSGNCFYMSNKGKWTSTDYCRTRRRALCASIPDCQEGWIGSRCDKQCHCYKENCTRDQYTCKYGCEVGWTGRGCFQEAALPVVEHYCVKNRTHYSLVLSLSSSNGTEAGILVPLDQDGKPITSVNSTEKFGEDGVFEISTKKLHLPFEPTFHERKLDEAVFEWSFRLRQHAGLRMQSDVDFRVKCDFSDLDVMSASTSIDFDIASFGKPSSSSTPPVETDTKIVLTDPQDGNPLTDITLGQPVKVVLKQPDRNSHSGEDGQGKPFLHMSPRKCYARGPDNVKAKQLTDESGCALDGDFFGWSDSNNLDLFSAAFPAFGVPGYSILNISCSLFPCFYGNTTCEMPCRFWR